MDNNQPAKVLNTRILFAKPTVSCSLKPDDDTGECKLTLVRPC